MKLLQSDDYGMLHFKQKLQHAPVAGFESSAHSALAPPAKHAASRGVTLIEVLIVVTILSLLAAGVTFVALPKVEQARKDTTFQNAQEVRGAVQRWRAFRGGGDCPTISQLVQDKEIDKASKIDDAWGSAYKISCTEDDVIVTSPGPDKKDGTADDISAPKGATPAVAK